MRLCASELSALGIASELQDAQDDADQDDDANPSESEGVLIVDNEVTTMAVATDEAASIDLEALQRIAITANALQVDFSSARAVKQRLEAVENWLGSVQRIIEVDSTEKSPEQRAAVLASNQIRFCETGVNSLVLRPELIFYNSLTDLRPQYSQLRVSLSAEMEQLEKVSCGVLFDASHLLITHSNNDCLHRFLLAWTN